jgi:hypothetical protein
MRVSRIIFIVIILRIHLFLCHPTIPIIY